jgi:hypothetical protein
MQAFSPGASQETSAERKAKVRILISMAYWAALTDALHVTGCCFFTVSKKFLSAQVLHIETH